MENASINMKNSSPQPAPISPIQQKPSWPELSQCARYIRRNGWEHRPLPEELTRFPDALVIPESLQQILTWSLVPGSNWSFDATKRVLDAPVQENTKDSLKPTTVNASSSTDNLSTVSHITSSTQPTSGKHEHSVDGERSLKHKLLSRMKRTKLSESSEVSPIKTTGPTLVECTSCFEELPESESTRLKSCRHWYCKECLSTLIVTAMATEASFPPKCCLSPIPLKQILKALSATQREDYQIKAAEYAEPTADRWYCPNTDCLQWIPRSKLKINKDLGYNCPHCATKLCRTCRGPAHAANTECPQDFGLVATLETAEIEGWQRCYKCRALVEHNRGCRHMTCRCGAGFCYVCGLKWQTCSCTETDAANKRAGAQRRREEHLAKVDAEAAEIARAIAEIEAMERREEEDRIRKEEERRREEEEQLRKLEALRLEEEARKQAEAEQAEQDFRNALAQSFRDEYNQIEDVLVKICAFQFLAITSRHETEYETLSKVCPKSEDNTRQEYAALKEILTRNAQKRRIRLANKHSLDLQTLEVRQEEEEDDLFLQVQMRLRGKSNKENRMERMLAEIRSKQEEEKKELEEKQKSELVELETKVATDAEGLKRWSENRISAAKEKHTSVLHKFGFDIGADRQYFEIVFARRSKMLAQHGVQALASIQCGEEPVGLTELDASKIQPSLPELDDGEPGPSGISRGPKIVMTPHGPLQMNRPSERRADDLYHEHQRVQGNRLSQPPIPGSYPSETSDIHSQQQSFPPPPPQMRPPAPPLTITTTPPGSSPPRVIKLVTNSSDPSQGSTRTQSNAMATETMASLAATLALQMIPASNTQESNKSSTTSSLVVEIAPSATKALEKPAKKSKLAFWKPREVTEEEMRRRMRFTVGDAF